MNKQVNGNLRLRRLQLRNLGLAFSLYQLLQDLLEALANNRPRPRIQECEIHIAVSVCVFEHGAAERNHALVKAGARPRSPQMIEKIGGRGGTRTRGPLLAKQAGQNTNSFVWCRLHGKPAKFPLSQMYRSCPELTEHRFVHASL